jgi:phenylacetate-coenzyme A ligase PaaK-like adenylate-forming protein
MDGMYLDPERVFVEVVDPDIGELVKRREKGELVVTSLTHHSTRSAACGPGT